MTTTIKKEFISTDIDLLKNVLKNDYPEYKVITEKPTKDSYWVTIKKNRFIWVQLVISNEKLTCDFNKSFGIGGKTSGLFGCLGALIWLLASFVFISINSSSYKRMVEDIYLTLIQKMPDHFS